MASNVRTTFFLCIMLFSAATFCETCSCPTNFTVCGKIPTQPGTATAPGRCRDRARVAAFFACVTTDGAARTVSRSSVDSDGSFCITVSEAQQSRARVNLTQPTVPCAVFVRPSSAAGYLGSALRGCEYEVCKGVTRVTGCVADRFSDVFPREV